LIYQLIAFWAGRVFSARGHSVRSTESITADTVGTYFVAVAPHTSWLSPSFLISKLFEFATPVIHAYSDKAETKMALVIKRRVVMTLCTDWA